MENNLGITELVDTSVDVIEVATTVADALSDGLDLSDAAAVLKIAPRAYEIYKDGKQALAELLDLTPDESREAVLQIGERANLPSTRVLSKVNEALNLLARTHQEVMDDIDLIHDWGEWAKSLKPDNASEN